MPCWSAAIPAPDWGKGLLIMDLLAVLGAGCTERVQCTKMVRLPRLSPKCKESRHHASQQTRSAAPQRPDGNDSHSVEDANDSHSGKGPGGGPGGRAHSETHLDIFSKKLWDKNLGGNCQSKSGNCQHPGAIGGSRGATLNILPKTKYSRITTS
jgi:hypothetical protein